MSAVESLRKANQKNNVRIPVSKKDHRCARFCDESCPLHKATRMTDLRCGDVELGMLGVSIVRVD